MVYEKSSLGMNEFTAEKRTLGVRERQVLLLVNGVRKLDDLERFFKRDHLLQTLSKLETEGYILPLNNDEDIRIKSNSAINAADTLRILSQPESDKPAPTICPTALSAVKTILLEASADYLGIMGRSIQSSIEHCADAQSLRQCISSWHMAMRESKLGRESASFLMEQIHQILEGKMLNESVQKGSQH